MLGDAGERMLYFEPAAMRALGVSRLRVAGKGKVPRGAEVVGLVAAGGGRGVVVGVDMGGRAYWTVVCNVGRGGNKVFLVEDGERGVERLEEEAVRWIVTGGVTAGCRAVVLVNEGGSW